MKRGSDSAEYRKRRQQLQRKKKRYMELREELQVAGEIPTEPSGAIRDEQVDPATQGGQALPKLTTQAIRNGWAVPEEKKPALVDEMVKIIDDPEESNKVKVAAFNALRQADQHQFERDNPETKSGANNTVVNITVETVEKKQGQIEVLTIGSNGSDGEQDSTGVPEATRFP